MILHDMHILRHYIHILVTFGHLCVCIVVKLTPKHTPYTRVSKGVRERLRWRLRSNVKEDDRQTWSRIERET